jgi:transcription termination factor Rho
VVVYILEEMMNFVSIFSNPLGIIACSIFFIVLLFLLRKKIFASSDKKNKTVRSIKIPTEENVNKIEVPQAKPSKEKTKSSAEKTDPSAEKTDHSEEILNAVYPSSPNDLSKTVVDLTRLRKMNLDTLKGLAKARNILQNGVSPSDAHAQLLFENMTAVRPTRQLKIAYNEKDMSARLLDIFAPVGAGQRGLIITPINTSASFMLQSIACGITHNHPDVELMMFLLEQRPEEVTAIKRKMTCEVISSEFGHDQNAQVTQASLVLEKAKRMVERGKDVVILLDSINSLAQAYNSTLHADSNSSPYSFHRDALRLTKRFLAAAHDTEEGGSLTIIATSIRGTRKSLDEALSIELQGINNMEVVIDKYLLDKYVSPPLEVNKSKTQNDAEILAKNTLQKINVLRKLLADMNSVEAMEFLLDKMRRCKSNDDFFNRMSK